MKFARYLEDTQTPEWKRAYIDYRQLKKCITQIKDAQASSSSIAESLRSSRKQAPPSASQPTPQIRATAASPSLRPDASPTTASRGGPRLSPASPFSFHPSREGDRLSDSRPQVYGSSGRTPPLRSSAREPSPPLEELPPPMQDLPKDNSTMNLQPPMAQGAGGGSIASRRRLSLERHNSAPSLQQASPRTFPLGGLRRRMSTRTSSSVPKDYSVEEIYRMLSPVERQFFVILDGELDKVEKFYREREREAIIFSSTLNEQLRELQAHRKLYHETQENAPSHWVHAVEVLTPLRRIFPASLDGTAAHNQRSSSPAPGQRRSAEGDGYLDPEMYHHNKRKLKKAILEHYHGIELLNNYRILNLTGFRKALKKFEKATKIPAQKPYMTEKVDRSAIASDTKITEMIKDVESLYAEYYTDNDKKRARERLRGAIRQNTQHSRTFRSGVYIGLGIPALVHAIYLSFQEDTRAAIPAWAALLQVYGGFLLPVVFGMLITINMIIWQQQRINYVFIFELDVRTAINPRQMIEIPAFLFLTLCYSIWLSFSRLGSVASTTWPLIWLVFALVFIFDPIPIIAKPSRYWFIKKCGKLLASGTGRVEFSDFWMGDQFCSLTFTLACFWTLGCSIENDWKDNTWSKCGLSNHWETPFVLSCIPSLLRFVQCVKRYADSGLYTHLINGGKYLSSVIYYVFYFLWRHNGAKLHGPTFGLFCFFSIIMSSYTSSWDILMDWSMLKPDAPHKFLRPELLYTNHIPAYYFAIISNILIRFIWVWFFVNPHDGLNITARTFIWASLEILRRFQWNFFRLENEHLGNMDQYRVTREVPLPYSLPEDPEEDLVETRGSDKWSLRRRKQPSSVHLPQVASPPRMEEDV